jgi:hypothetical protein
LALPIVLYELGTVDRRQSDGSFAQVVIREPVTAVVDPSNGDAYLQLRDSRILSSGGAPLPSLRARDIAVTGRLAPTFCVLVGDRRVECWGDGREGQLGDGTLLAYREARGAVHGLE